MLIVWLIFQKEIRKEIYYCVIFNNQSKRTNFVKSLNMGSCEVKVFRNEYSKRNHLISLNPGQNFLKLYTKNEKSIILHKNKYISGGEKDICFFFKLSSDNFSSWEDANIV